MEKQYVIVKIVEGGKAGSSHGKFCMSILTCPLVHIVERAIIVPA